MTRTEKFLVGVVVVLSGACLFVTYLWIDRSISLAYSTQGEESAMSAVKGLEQVLQREWRGMPEAEVLNRLNAAFPQGPQQTVIVKREGAIIWLDEVPFNIEKGKLKSIGSR